MLRHYLSTCLPKAGQNHLVWQKLPFKTDISTKLD